MIRPRSVTNGVVALAALAAASPAGAATLAETFVPTGTNSNVTVIQTGSPGDRYKVPFEGVITSWAYQATAGADPIKLKVVRPAGGTSFTTVGEDGPHPMNAFELNSFPVRIPVQAGDVLGLFVPAPGAYFYRGGGDPAYTYRAVFSDPAPGSTVDYPGSGNMIQIDVSAVLEPDCDSDGLADETEDADLSPCPPAPDTQITTGPNDRVKAKRKRAKATFEFDASEPGASFECALDSVHFAPCASPHTVKVKNGNHSFAVRASDAGGNVDASPATDDWEVKKKRKK